MDFVRTDHGNAMLHPATRNALEAFGTAAAITLATTFGVNWLLHTFNYSADLADTLTEAARWFLPMFAYLWSMFSIIDMREH